MGTHQDDGELAGRALDHDMNLRNMEHQRISNYCTIRYAVVALPLQNEHEEDMSGTVVAGQPSHPSAQSLSTCGRALALPQPMSAALVS